MLKAIKRYLSQLFAPGPEPDPLTVVREAEASRQRAEETSGTTAVLVGSGNPIDEAGRSLCSCDDCRKTREQRNADIARRLRAGETFGEIAHRYKITRERVRQIAHKVCPEVFEHRCSAEGCTVRPKRFTSQFCSAHQSKTPRPRKEAKLCACGKKAIYRKRTLCPACYKSARYHEDAEYRELIRHTQKKSYQRSRNRPPIRTYNPERAKRVVEQLSYRVPMIEIARSEGVHISTIDWYRRKYFETGTEVQ